jgi:uncharacterized membrane protein YqjE
MRYLFGVEQHDVVLLLMLVTSLLIMIQEDKINRLKSMLNDIIFQANLIIAFIFSMWIIQFQKVEDAKNEDERKERIKLRKSLFLGYLAFIIALCAAFDLVVLPFWVVWVSSYYFDLN